MNIEDDETVPHSDYVTIGVVGKNPGSLAKVIRMNMRVFIDLLIIDHLYI